MFSNQCFQGKTPMISRFRQLLIWKRDRLPSLNLSRLALLRGSFLLLFLLAFVHSQTARRNAVVSVRIEDADSGDLTPVRVRLTDHVGNPVSPPEEALAVPGSVVGIPEEALAVMFGRNDRAEGFARLPDGSFYVEGRFTLQLQPGRYELAVSKGYEYRQLRLPFELEAGQELEQTLTVRRWINMPDRGWYSADDHIHLRRSPRENPLILRWLAAEDIHIGNLLQMGDFWTTYFNQYGWGKQGRYREGDRILTSGQEDPRTPEIGHTISLGASDFVRVPEYYRYDKVFDRVHELGGISGYAHQGMSFHGYRGMTLDVPQQKIDFLELLQFCVEGGPLHLDHYYHFLDLGFRLTATAGSDFPWCGRGPAFGLEQGCSQIGDARFYTYLGDGLTFEKWLDSVRNGHTFVSSGPILDLRVNQALPGTTLELEAGATLRITAEAFGEREQIPLENLEIVSHGKVLKSVSAANGEERERLSIQLEFPVRQGIWLAARCKAGTAQFAHTTPVYVTVDGKGFYNPETAPDYLRQSLSYLREIERSTEVTGAQPNHQIGRHRDTLRDRIAEVRSTLQTLQEQLSQ
jgi:hypothetical protein